jgi:hypothetical protein
MRPFAPEKATDKPSCAMSLLAAFQPMRTELFPVSVTARPLYPKAPSKSAQASKEGCNQLR